MEILDVVDDNNNVVGNAPIDVVYDKKLNHRIVHVMIFNEKGELFLQQRSAKKSFCPGHWVTSAGGHVQKGESSFDGASRELKEELGVSCELKKILEFLYENRGLKKFVTVYSAMNNGPFNLNVDEVAGGRYFNINDVRDMVRKNELIHPELAVVVEKMYP